MGLYKLLAYFRATPGKVRKTYHRELGEPSHPTSAVRCPACNWGADYASFKADPFCHLPAPQCPRCGAVLVEGER